MAVKDNEKNSVNEAEQKKSCCCAADVKTADALQDVDAVQDDVCCCSGKTRSEAPKKKGTL